MLDEFCAYIDPFQRAVSRMRRKGIKFKNELLASYGMNVYVNGFVWTPHLYSVAKNTPYLNEQEPPSQ